MNKSIAVLIALGFLVSACASPDNQVHKPTEQEMQRITASQNPSSYLTFAGTYTQRKNARNTTVLKKNGRFIIRQNGNEWRGVYTVSNGLLTLYGVDGRSASGRIEARTVLDSQGDPWDFSSDISARPAVGQPAA
jgi:hypothetical protein